ncbi:MAG: glycosyltransferase [Candidatus Lutacidiplasmatales archaeon]
MLPLLLLGLALLATVVVLLYQGFALLLASEMPRLDPSGSSKPGDRPLVSVVIAARDEEADLPGCLDDLLRQSYPNLEILVVDGGSTDRTREVAREKAPRVRLIEEPALPEGWVGKNWACDVGYRASRGEYLLFLDADVRLNPCTIAATVEWTESTGAQLSTLAPRIELGSFWEKLVLPFYVQMVLTYFRTPHVNRANSRAAMANGQFFLVRRPAYERVGGHAGFRGYVLEDVRIAEEFRGADLPMRVAWAPALMTTRMYRDRRELFEGLLKNVHGTRFSALRQVGFLAGLIGFFWLPLALLPLGLFVASPSLIALGAILYLALFAKHAGFSRAVGGSAVYGLLFPAAVGFYVVLVATSIVRGLRGRPVAWKGRSYPI